VINSFQDDLKKSGLKIGIGGWNLSSVLRESSTLLEQSSLRNIARYYDFLHSVSIGDTDDRDYLLRDRELSYPSPLQGILLGSNGLKPGPDRAIATPIGYIPFSTVPKLTSWIVSQGRPAHRCRRRLPAIYMHAEPVETECGVQRHGQSYMLRGFHCLYS
jgi:hypothetical protein